MHAPAFTSPWTAKTPYWIIVQCLDEAQRSLLTPHLGWLKTLHNDPALLGFQTGPEWVGSFEQVTKAIHHFPATASLKAAAISSEALPGEQEIRLSLRPLTELNAIAQNLWLAQALAEDRLICCMQKVVDRRQKHVGFEAFARIEQTDGTVMGGGAVMQASRALRIEYLVDRLMHKQAIRRFVEFDLEGLIFINFLTGFIHRTEIYLDGLSQAVSEYGVPARSVVLDVPLMDYASNMLKLKTITQYCRARGFAMALDDITLPAGLPSLLHDIRPAFVKLDGRLGAAMLDVKKRSVVLDIIRIAHAAGASVLAEGVESEALYRAYFDAGVDMFQGYYIAEPERYPPVSKKRKSA